MIEIEDLETGHHQQWFTMAELAKMLNLKIKDGKHTKYVGRNILFKILRFNKILTKDNSPSQSFINLGLARLHSTNKLWHRYTLPIFSERGVDYLKERFANGKYVIYYEKTIRNKYVVNIDDVC